MASAPQDAQWHDRDLGFRSEAELSDITETPGIAIVGAGGEGFPVALTLATMGIRRFDIAEPDFVSESNRNRLPVAAADVGRNKAEVLREKILAINPDADVRIYPEGLTPENVACVLGRASIAFDGSDLNRLDVGALLAREARRRDIPTVLSMSIGWAAVVMSFDPRSKWTFERFMGFSDDTPLDKIAQARPDLSRAVAYLPNYGDFKTFLAVQQDRAEFPTIVEGVENARSLVATEVFKIIARGQNRRHEPIWAPEVAFHDPYTHQAGVIRHRRLAFYRHLVTIFVRSRLGLNPRASYGRRERDERSWKQMNDSILSNIPA